MPRLAARNLWARKGRALTTTLAVFVGVALVAGTYVLTDTINAAFDQIFSESLKGTDVVITAREPVSQDSGEVQTVPASLLRRVEATRGVAEAAGAIFEPGGFFDRQGKRIGSQFSPKFISSVLPPRLESLTYTEGHPPRTSRQASIDEAAAQESGLRIGDPLRIAGQRRARTYFLVGLTKLGSASFGGASIAQLILPEAQRITDNRGRFDQISVAARAGVPAGLLKLRIERALPGSVRVETGQQNADRLSRQIRDNLSFFRVALLVFAGVALFVGAFLIFNTFSITVAQRIREFGMLRTLGTSRAQILGSVVAEAALIGTVGSVLGLAGGVGFARGIQALFEAIGIDLPTTSPVIATRTVVVSLLIGISITLISSLVPAVRSTRVPPLAALREGELPGSRRHGALLAALAVLIGVIGLAALLLGLFGGISDSGQAAGLMGAGAVLMLFGVSLFSPRLVRPLASLAGIPLERLRGLTGRLARENTQRKPGRTAATAAALMIGLALVTFVTVFAAGLKGSVASAVDRNFQGELVIQNSDGFSPIPARAARAASRVPGVRTVSSLRTTQAVIEGAGKGRVSGLDPANAAQVLSLDWQQGSVETLRSLQNGQAILDDAYAGDHGFEVGDRIRLLTQTGRRPSFTVAGTVKDQADLLGSVVVTQAAITRLFGVTEDTYAFVKLAPGASPDAVQDRLKAVMDRSFPTTDVLNQDELKQNQESQINQLLGLIYALLSLAVIVSLFGIANTLALSIHERTRELGMLRAIGMSRRQVRRVIRYEAVITALIGAVLGLGLGVVFAALVSRPLADQGFTLSYPVGQLIAIMVAAAVAGVLAAIGPARRASRLDVLEALAYE
ncbi:MAG: FtsX-like permease family protein [Solirubrobacterales bacterium]